MGDELQDAIEDGIKEMVSDLDGERIYVGPSRRALLNKIKHRQKLRKLVNKALGNEEE